MRDFFHIDRVNGTIEEERILWREGQLHQERKKIFLHSRREEKIRERNLSYGVFHHCGWRGEKEIDNCTKKKKKGERWSERSGFFLSVEECKV